MLPHLASAHNLALWLLRDLHDTEDAVQEAYLRAYKSYHRWAGENAAAWILRIVRNTCMTKLKARSRQANVIRLGAAMGDLGEVQDGAPLPDARTILSAEQRSVRQAVARLPRDYREVIVLREFEDLSYREIAAVAGVPVGTVMSRLSRGRRRLREMLEPLAERGAEDEM